MTCLREYEKNHKGDINFLLKTNHAIWQFKGRFRSVGRQIETKGFDLFHKICLIEHTILYFFLIEIYFCY
jgi:hypothetical protein